MRVRLSRQSMSEARTPDACCNTLLYGALSAGMSQFANGVAPTLSACCDWHLYLCVLCLFAGACRRKCLPTIRRRSTAQVAPLCDTFPTLTARKLCGGPALRHLPHPHCMEAVWRPFRKVDCTTSVHSGRLESAKRPLTCQCALSGFPIAFAQETGPGASNTSGGTFEWNTRVMFLPWWPVVFMQNSSAIAKNLS